MTDKRRPSDERGDAMRFLRLRRDEVEQVWTSDKPSAVDRARALSVLSGCVMIVSHPYQRDPQSGSGNCWCGRHDRHPLHQVVVEPARGGVGERLGDPE